MKRNPVTSSNIKSMGYDPAKKTLEIEFKTGVVYQYHPFTEAAWVEFQEADSKGKYFHKNIKDNPLLDYKKV